MSNGMYGGVRGGEKFPPLDFPRISVSGIQLQIVFRYSIIVTAGRTDWAADRFSALRRVPDMNDVIREKLKMLPDSPGVYIMLDADGNVIYVGKARILKNRVRQYFHAGPKTDKVAAMVACIADFSWVITDSEIDALSLENNLIKKHKPKYNILLKDDKTYPYIRVSLTEKYPSFQLSRKLQKGYRYFGPYMGGVRCRDVLEIVHMAFGVRICGVKIGEKVRKPCLEHDVGKCGAPCAFLVGEEEYSCRVKEAVRFLSGDDCGVEELLKAKMAEYAEREEFELAIGIRDRLDMLSRISQRRITALKRDISADVFAYASNKLYAAVAVTIIRGGIMQGVRSFAVENASADDEALYSFIAQYYANQNLPDEIILPDCCDSVFLEGYFESAFERKVSVVIPKQGVKKQLVGMAEKNAAEYLEKVIDRIRHREDMTINACVRLKELLHLSRYPRRMECYDISDISGTDKVGSMVVFIDGEPDRDSYRRFRIRTVEGADDFASLKEVLTRRLKKLGTAEETRFEKPDLVIIDGGKGQLSSARDIFTELGIEGVDLISLAKREEEIFTGGEAPVVLDKRDMALHVLQRIRDEAHRFAITYFRNIHSKNSLASVLAEIPGVGRVKGKALLEKFGTIGRIMGATEEELAATEGIGPALARTVKQYFEEGAGHAL